MITGTYVKDGQATEIVLGGGLTQYVFEEPPMRELQVFTLTPKKEGKRKTKSMVKNTLLALSVLIPNTFYWYFIADFFSVNKPFTIGFLLAQAWLVIFLYANARKK